MQIQQMMMQQNAMFAGQMQYAQQLGAPMQQSMYGAAPAPWQIPAYAMPHAAAPYGERLATGMASFASNVAAPTFMGGMALAGGLGMLGRAGRIFDPFGSAISGGMAGFASGGIAGAMGGAALGALPGYLAMKAVDVYGGAFMGGIQDQSNVNSMLRSNFRFYGGSGPMGRGFSQGQMGQIGSILSGTARGDLTTSMGELTQLTQMGAQMGQFNGVRDVQQFSQKFKQMLSTLRTIQDELGGSLTEAATFARSANQNGVFRNLGSYAAQMRTAQGTTGMSMDQLGAMAMQGAGLSQMMGGRRAQGAMGALRTASSLGAALSSGVINDEALQAATGATGAEGIQALTGRLMEHTARFSRRAVGRYSIFAMSNARGTGLDAEMTDRFLTGEVGAGDISRAAHRNVGRMGRARAINNEGLLRGALLEQGGLAGQIGALRMQIGDRVLDQGDDMASLFMQRRMHMSRPEAELMTSLMRNQGSIAMREMETRGTSRRETALMRDIQENRSLDSFMANVGHSMEEGLGISAARDMGRRLLTKASQISERVMNHLLGIAESTMTSGDRAAASRIGMGRATEADWARASRVMQSTVGGDNYDPRRTGLLETRDSVQQAFARRNVRVTNFQDTNAAFDALEAARRGFVSGRDANVMATMERMGEGQVGTAMMRAQLAASGNENGDVYHYLRQYGFTANATDAYRARRGMAALEGAPTRDSMMGRAVGRLMDAFDPTSQERATNFLASGGHAAQDLERQLAEVEWRPGENRNVSESRQYLEARGGRQDGSQRRNLRGGGSMTLAEIEERQGLLNSYRNLDQEQVQAVMGSEDWKRTMDFISADGRSEEEMLQELTRFGNNAQRNGGPNSQTSMALVQMLTSDIQNGRGVGREWQAGGGGVDQQARTEFLRSMSSRGNMLASVGGSTELAQMYQQMGSGSVSGRAFTELRDRIQQKEDARMSSFMGMSDTDFNAQMSRYTDAIGSAGSEDAADALRMERMSIMQARGVDQRLRGQGRRGAQGSREEAMNLLAGGATEFTVGSGRTERSVDRRKAMQMLRRGGDDADRIISQMYEASGVGALESAGGLHMSLADYSRQVREAMSGGAMQAGPAGDRIRESLRKIGDSSAQERQEALERQQRESDPMGAQTVERLQEVNTTLQNNERAEQQRHNALVTAVNNSRNIDLFGGGDSGSGGPPTGEGG